MLTNPKDNIRNLVAANKTDEVIKALRELSDQVESSKISDAIILISARYENFVHEKITGTIGSEESTTKLNKLNLAILNLLEGIPEEALGLVTEANTSTSKTSKSKDDELIERVFKYTLMLLFIFSVLAMLISIGFLIYKTMNNRDQESISFFGYVPFWASLIGIGVSGFFFVYTKK